MKRKMNRVFMIAAAALFLFMLVVNVRMALGNPFGYMDEGALAEYTTQGELPLIDNAVGETETCIQEICVEIEWPNIWCSKLQISFGTRVHCKPGGDNPCQPSVCL